MEILVNTPGQMGEILLSARKGKGLTQAEAATRVGIGQPRLSLLETTSTAGMSLEQILALFSVYGLQLVVRSRDVSPAASGGEQPEW
jgi:HTH-type transcriptional regulator / antitoxin HipB